MSRPGGGGGGASQPIAMRNNRVSAPPRGDAAPEASAAGSPFPTLLASTSPFGSPRAAALSDAECESSDSDNMPVARHIFRPFVAARAPSPPAEARRSPDLEAHGMGADDSDDASSPRSPAVALGSEWPHFAAATHPCRDDLQTSSTCSGTSSSSSGSGGSQEYNTVSASAREHSGPLAITTGGARLCDGAHSNLIAHSLTPRTNADAAAGAAGVQGFSAFRSQSLRGDVTTGTSERSSSTAAAPRPAFGAARSVSLPGAEPRRLSLLDAFDDMNTRHEMLARAIEHDSEVEDAAERVSSLSEPEMSSGELSWLEIAASHDDAAWAADAGRLQPCGDDACEASPPESPLGAARSLDFAVATHAPEPAMMHFTILSQACACALSLAVCAHVQFAHGTAC